jgi:hypothetical protein
VNEPIDVMKLHDCVHALRVGDEDVSSDENTDQSKIVWVETDKSKWNGYPPKIEVIFDERYGYILSVFLQIICPKTVRVDKNEMKRIFFHHMWINGVFIDEESLRRMTSIDSKLSLLRQRKDTEAHRKSREEEEEEEEEFMWDRRRSSHVSLSSSSSSVWLPMDTKPKSRQTKRT